MLICLTVCCCGLVAIGYLLCCNQRMLTVANSSLFIAFLLTLNVIRQMAPLFSKVD